MKRIFTYTISPEDAGCILRDFLIQKGFSRHILTGLKPYPDRLLLNGKHPFLNCILQAEDTLAVTLCDETSSLKIPPVKLPLSVLYEDEDILLLNKPADMPIHPSQGNYGNTLANAVAWYYQQRGETFVYRCINRLDRDTTGVLVLAKNALSAALLSKMMQQRQIHRTYLAIVEGTPPSEGIIDAPIARVCDSTIERQVDFCHGERAVTHYRLLESRGNYALLQLHLETGRTHQIRVHMKHIGHPLPGDFLYNPNYQDFRRQPLHSWKLEFQHPITGESLTFQAPLPEDMHFFNPVS